MPVLFSFPALSTTVTLKLYVVSAVSPVYSYEAGKLVCSIDVVQVLAVFSLYSNMYFAIPDVASVPDVLVFTVTEFSVLLSRPKSTLGGGVVSFHTSAVLSFDLFPAPSTVLA